MNQLNILFEDKDILVCHKPAGVASQSDRSFLPDMVSLIRNHLAAAGQYSQDKIPYVGVVHRLDKPVEGILVYGKTPAAAAFLSRQVSDSGKNRMEKGYRATVYGTLPLDEASAAPHILEQDLVQDKRSNYSRVYTPTPSLPRDLAAAKKKKAGAKPARLSYRCTGHGTENDRPVSYVQIQLFTGRHHQIRVQFSHMGYPIVGDTKYGMPNQKCPLALCACSLTFTHPNGQVMTFSI